MLRNSLPFPLLLIGLLMGTVACDNVGRAFDPNVNPAGPGSETGVSTVQVVPAGGTVLDGRPLVREAYPSGAGWPGTVPIVVEFSESLNQASILPTIPGGLDARIGVRAQGTEQLIPALYDFLANGRLLVIRPVTNLSNLGNPIYEVVMFPEGRDVDGLRFLVNGDEKVLTDFQVNEDETIVDGSIVAIFPRDNFSEQMRGSDFFAVFDRPANAGTFVDPNLFLQTAGGAPIDVSFDVPLSKVSFTGSEDDPRVVRLTPDSPLSASTSYDFTVTESITFGQQGELDFSGRTPFSVFTTIGPSEPSVVELGNPSAGFPNKINRQNILSVTLNVETPVDTEAGDLVVGRIYGGDAATSETYDIAFTELTANAAVAGQQTVELDFTGEFGTIAIPEFDEGDLIFTAQIRRGSQSTGFVRNASSANPRFDITPPTLKEVGPPGSGTDILTDCSSLAFYGVASESVAEASLTDGFSTVPMFGASNSGRFLMLPVPLDRLAAPRDYSLTLTDTAGNMSATAAVGLIRQRGQITGALSGELTVEAYDQATLLPIEGATVLVDPGVPTMPATGQLVGLTDAAGRVSFSSGLGVAHTVTIVRAGYELITLCDTQAALVSLPLTPLADSAADLIGTVDLIGSATLSMTPGASAILGSTEIADRSVVGIQTTTADPTQIPATAIQPNRAQIITAFGGIFEATGTPTYLFQACGICGADLVSPTAPVTPPVPGGEASTNVFLSPAVTPFGSLLSTHFEDFGLAVGLDLANLKGGLPKARVTTSVSGFAGQALTGIGAVTLPSGTLYGIDVDCALPIIASLADFAPLSWVMTEAEDTAGRISRVRGIFFPDTGGIIGGVGPSSIPVVSPPVGPFVGSPEVSYLDVVSDGVVPGFVEAFTEVTATDEAGRSWRMIVPDRDAAGTIDMLQFPDLATVGVVGLAPGDWQVVVESRLVLTFSNVDDFVLTDRFRHEVNYARSAPEMFTVQ